MTKRLLAAIAAAIFTITATAADFYGSTSTSVRDSAVPGEYFFYKGVEAIKHDDLRHAVAMYKVAASWAYKPAEYNLGVIFAKGEGGVPVDLPQSYAWMVLAAERGDATYVAARDHVKSALSADQLKQSESLLVDMQKTYGDQIALARAKARWHDVLFNATGSRVGFTAGNMQSGSASGFRGNPTEATKMVSPKKSGGAPSGITGATDLIGNSGGDGSIAYRDLRATDNPYDPRFNVGVITVGDPKGVGPNKDDQAKTSTPPPDHE